MADLPACCAVGQFGVDDRPPLGFYVAPGRCREPVPDQLGSPGRIATVQDRCGRGAHRQHRQLPHGVEPAVVVDVPAQVRPRPLDVADRDGVLAADAKCLRPVLRQRLVLLGESPVLAQHLAGPVDVPAPEGEPGQQQPKMGLLTGRWFEFQRLLEHLPGAGPFAESEQRLGGVAGHQGAGRPLDPPSLGELDAGQRLRHRVPVMAGEVQRVGIVQPEPDGGAAVELGQLTGPGQLGQALVLVPLDHQRRAQGVAGVGLQARLAELDRGRHRRPGQWDGVAAGDHGQAPPPGPHGPAPCNRGSSHPSRGAETASAMSPAVLPVRSRVGLAAGCAQSRLKPELDVARSPVLQRPAWSAAHRVRSRPLPSRP